LNTPLNAGQSINVEWLLGVKQIGSFRFYVNIEALPDCISVAELTRTLRESAVCELKRSMRAFDST
jgi:hypothetical protein